MLKPDTVRRYTSAAGIVISLVIGLAEYLPTLLIVVMPVLLGVIGLIYGLDCALRVSSSIARERENGTFDLLALSPPGALLIGWALCASALYRGREFMRFHSIVKTSIIIGVVLVVVLTGFETLIQLPLLSRDARLLLPTFVRSAHLLAILGILYADYAQGAVLGCLIGLLIPTYTTNRIDASLYTLGIFLLTQITLYAAAVWIGFNFLPDAFIQIGWTDRGMEFLLALFRLLIFLGLHEISITLIWEHLVKRLNARPIDIQSILAPAG